MNDLQDVDLHDVAEYLKSRNLVDERPLPCYVRWLQRFLAGPGGDPQYTQQDAQRVFLEISESRMGVGVAVCLSGGGTVC